LLILYTFTGLLEVPVKGGLPQSLCHPSTGARRASRKT